MDNNTLKANRSAFSIDNILEHKTQTTEVIKKPQAQTPTQSSPCTAFAPPAGSPVQSIYDLSTQYALKNLESGSGGLLSPSSVRFNPVYSDPASLLYQQMLNLQKNSSLFMPHFQAAALAAAAQPAAYCDQYSPFLDCEGELWCHTWRLIIRISLISNCILYLYWNAQIKILSYKLNSNHI